MPLLSDLAREVARSRFGNGVYLRGLIEVSNYCRNDCRYCGIRRSNTRAERYRMSREEILSSCAEGHAIGLRTFVLQGGEDPALTDGFLVDTIREIRRRWPECAITLSLGERPEASYRALFEAGATRYLLRHETVNAELYGRLHPREMSLKNRLACLDSLKSIGYQVGTGFMVGVPGQTERDLVRELLFMEKFRPEMIGIGPFIPHRDTPLAAEGAGSVERTLELISLLRLLLPDALIPATTSLATLSPDGRVRGILAGANVVMPNLSPTALRAKYSLYDGKAATGAESAEGVAELERQLQGIGYEINWDRGDYKTKT